MPVKAKNIKDLPLKNELDGSESLLVQDSNGTKQAPLGTIVDEIKQNSQEKIREIESELAQTNAQLSHKVNKNIYYLSDYLKTDDNATDFQNLVNKIKDKFERIYSTDNYNEIFKENIVVIIDVNKLFLNKKITIPFYIKLKSNTNVLIETSINNDSCIHYTTEQEPHFTGIEWYENLFEFSKNMGNLIDGSQGSITFKNVSNVNKGNGFLISDANKTTCIEIGSKDTEVNGSSAYYTLKSVLIADYNIGIKLNLINNHICNFDKVYAIFNNYGVVLGNNGNGVNSGEGMTFTDSNISNNRVAFYVNDYVNLNLNNCYIDYNQLNFLIGDVVGSSIIINGGNIEGFYSVDYIEKYQLEDILLKGEYYGMLYIMRDVNRFLFPVICQFSNVNISPTRGIRNTIRNLKRNSNRDQIIFSNTRISGLSNNEKDLYKYFRENNSFVADGVSVIKNNIVPNYNRVIPLTATTNNLSVDSFLKGVTVGTTDDYFSNTVIGNIIINESYGGTTYTITNSTTLGNNVIELYYDNTRENGCTVSFELNQKINAMVGDIFWFNGLVGGLENGTLMKSMREYDDNGKVVNEMSCSDNVIKSLQSNEYIPFLYDTFVVTNPKTSYVKFRFTVKVNKINSPTRNFFKIGNILSMKIN